MNDILNSVGKWFKERTTSPLYGTFILSVILWNWKFFYILFWQGDQNLSVPKIEYIQNTILNSENYLIHFIYFLILPIISTYIIVWWLSYLSNWAHKRHLEFYYQKRLIIDDAKLAYERREQKALTTLSTIKKEQAETKKEIIKNTSKEDRWFEEYLELKNRPIFTKFSQLTKVLYDNSGKTHRWNGADYVRVIDSDVLGVVHSKDLVTKNGNDEQETIELTEKGKYFISKYFE